MALVHRRPLALADLAEIWSYIAEDSESSADRWLEVLEEKLVLLARTPSIGRARPELFPDLRSFPVGRYLLFFLVLPGGIDLVRVLHSARDISVDEF